MTGAFGFGNKMRNLLREDLAVIKSKLGVGYMTISGLYKQKKDREDHEDNDGSESEPPAQGSAQAKDQ